MTRKNLCLRELGGRNCVPGCDSNDASWVNNGVRNHLKLECAETLAPISHISHSVPIPAAVGTNCTGTCFSNTLLADGSRTFSLNCEAKEDGSAGWDVPVPECRKVCPVRIESNRIEES